MKRLFLAIGFSIATALPAFAQEDEIQTVIQSQIEAFKADDFETAYSFASPKIKGFYRNPDRFGLMVREGFPMVWRPGSVEYLGMRRDGGHHVQTVMITDGEGTIHMLEYKMIQNDGGWQIDAVYPIRNVAPAA